MLLIKNIKKLLLSADTKTAGAAMQQMASVDHAFLLIREGRIADFGAMEQMPQYANPRQTIDALGKIVMPAFCDSHTHLVYAGSREQEFVDKIRGLSYEEIARRGGGILNSAKLLHHTSEEALLAQALERAWEIIALGTGAVEIKSGYGLNVEDELKMLRVIKRISKETPLTVKATLLAAHAVPVEYKGRQSEYVDIIVNEMIPQAAAEELADYVDVFCEQGFFTVEDTERILTAGLQYGLVGKVHANQLSRSGGIQAGVKHKAVSVDHLDFTGAEEIACLLQSNTVPTLLPGSNFFLAQNYPPARTMIDAGLPVALASNYNPGSSPGGSMPFILSLACTQLKMTPEEAIHAATINGACAMGIDGTHGSITRGKKANILITKAIPGYAFLPYAFSTNVIDTVILNGEPLHTLQRTK